MRLTESKGPDASRIQYYDAESITINHQRYDHPILIQHPNIQPWDISQLTDLSYETIKSWLSLEPDIILLGTGNPQQTISLALRQTCLTEHVAIEIMSTPSACRCYNILVEEGRNVLAALWIGSNS